ncbi:hypothetical protein GQX74_011727 [Glossina fuscipes]|nr:hypothetical protein GQX74_011727 [Glossina fuscipes]
MFRFNESGWSTQRRCNCSWGGCISNEFFGIFFGESDSDNVIVSNLNGAKLSELSSPPNSSVLQVSDQSILKTNLKPTAITENIIIIVQDTNVNINPIVRPYSSQTGRLKSSQVIVSNQLTTVANISDGRDERIVSIMRIITVNRSTKVKRINNIAVESR